MTAARGTNTLILSPLSPSGLDAYLDRVASSCPTASDVVAISYTQPPREWIAAWKTYVGDAPDRSVFVKGGSVDADAAADGEFDRVLSADPADPMSVVVPVEKQLAAWESTDADTVISLQTLSVLLQYSDADTVFRYLNLVTHKVRAVGARGYYQIDPELHDEATVNALKVLFDTVERVSEDELADRRDAQTASDGAGTSPVNHLVSLYESSKSRLSNVLTPSGGRGASENDAPSASTADAGDAADPSGAPAEADDADPTADADVNAADDPGVPATAGEELLTDGERIRRLLLRSGGQMRQTALVSALPWSSSTVSRKLTELEERGEVSRIQVGRGKVVFYPGSEPEAAKSPFEETKGQPQISE